MPKKPTILVVDDEPQILRAMQDLLEDDCIVLAASSGQEGLLLIDQRPEICVILSDQRMPKMDGSEFFLRVQEKSTATRIMFSGFTDFGDLVRAINDGHIYAFVSKPFNLEELHRVLRSAFQLIGASE